MCTRTTAPQIKTTHMTDCPNGPTRMSMRKRLHASRGSFTGAPTRASEPMAGGRSFRDLDDGLRRGGGRDQARARARGRCARRALPARTAAADHRCRRGCRRSCAGGRSQGRLRPAARATPRHRGGALGGRWPRARGRARAVAQAGRVRCCWPSAPSSSATSRRRRWSGVARAWPWQAVAIWLAGFDVYKKGLTALRHGRLNINALMTVAVTGAFAIGQWPEAAMVMALYAIAEAIEARAVDRARNAIKGLLAMAPEEASVRQADGSWGTRPVARSPWVRMLRVKPGERVPMDGVVRSGQTSINQAPVTGESIPVDKTRQVIRSSPARSTNQAPSSSRSRLRRRIRRLRASSMPSRKRRRRARRRRASSTASRRSTRRPSS
jgi:hypothetical protein